MKQICAIVFFTNSENVTLASQVCFQRFGSFPLSPQLAHSQEQKEEDDKGELVEQLQTLQTH